MIGFGDILPALRLALAQLADPRLLKVLALTLVITLVLVGPFYLVFVVLAWFIELVLPASLSLPWLGEVSFLGVYTVGLVSKASWVFWTYVMAPVALAVIGLFYDMVVDAVETRHYPGLPALRRRPVLELVGYALRFLGLTLGVSLLALVASFFAGFLAPLVFILANGYLIAREYFETVALRRLPEAETAQRRARDMPVLWALGALLAAALTVPYVNLVVPLAGVAAFTHLYHRGRGNA